MLIQSGVQNIVWGSDMINKCILISLQVAVQERKGNLNET